MTYLEAHRVQDWRLNIIRNPKPKFFHFLREYRHLGQLLVVLLLWFAATKNASTDKLLPQSFIEARERCWLLVWHKRALFLGVIALVGWLLDWVLVEQNSVTCLRLAGFLTGLPKRTSLGVEMGLSYREGLRTVIKTVTVRKWFVSVLEHLMARVFFLGHQILAVVEVLHMLQVSALLGLCMLILHEDLVKVWAGRVWVRR